MAKDIITRFKLETTQYDSKLKSAAKGLSDFSKTATQAKEGFNQFTKSNIDAAKALGSMATSTTNAKDKVKELVGAFNEAAKAYNQLSEEQKQSDWAKALSGSLTQLQQRIRDAKKEMQGLTGSSGGSFLSSIGGKMSGALQVFAGNMMTKAAGVGLGMVDEMAGMVQQGIELAKAGEGIRIAFERLGRGDILDGLRQATHGTVTDLELMKAAVKFNDFKLPLNELGTMLAFAQQKAKDTGQSVDYMVDSIVTGLGRKSLMILDNLGLSANEIKEKMKETGDMTTAVGAIIREQMSKAGDYVETAADRAAQANVSLQNKMEELGRKFAPVEEASNQLWTSMKIAILDVVGGPLAKMLNQLHEAGRLRNQMNSMAGGNSSDETEKQLNFLRRTSPENRRKRYDKQISIYTQQENAAWREVNRLKAERESLRKERLKRGANDDDWGDFADYDNRIEEARRKALSWQRFRADYARGAAELIKTVKDDAADDDNDNKKKTKTTKGGGDIKEEKDEFEEIIGLIPKAEEAVKSLQQQIRLSEDVDELKFLNEELRQAQENLKELQNVGNTISPAVSDTRGLIERRRDNYVAGLAAQGEQYNENILNSVLGIQHRYGLSDINMSSIQDAMENGGKVSDEELREILRQLNEKLSGRGISVSADGNGNISDERTIDKIKKDIDKGNELYSKAVGGISNIVGGMQQLGVEIPEGLSNLLNALNGISTILTGISSILSFISIMTTKPALLAMGGAIRAATGVVAGRNFSGDTVPALLNSGEVVLNRAEVSTLAQTIENGNRNESVDRQPYVTGEYIFLGLNNYLRGSGKGSIVTAKQ